MISVLGQRPLDDPPLRGFCGPSSPQKAVFVLGLVIGLFAPLRASADTGPPASETEGSGAAPDGAAPAIELDGVAFSGATNGRRDPAPGRLQLDGLILLHFGDGFGAGGQLRMGAFGLRASVGYEPLVFIFDPDPQDQTLGDLEFSNSAQLNLDTLWLSTKSDVGASLGYRYNTVLGHGLAVAFQSMFELWSQRFSFSIPIMYFPEGTERVREDYGLSGEYHINFPFGAGVQYGIGVAWML